MTTTPTGPEGTIIPDATNPEKYTRPISFDELFKAAYVLSMGVARLTDEMLTTQNGTSNPQSWDELRNSSEVLTAIADHVCNDARYWDDEPATAAPSSAPRESHS